MCIPEGKLIDEAVGRREADGDRQQLDDGVEKTMTGLAMAREGAYQKQVAAKYVIQVDLGLLTGLYELPHHSSK